MTETPAAAVIELLGLFERHRIHVWLDGGWAVDALLGEQTRPHADVDIVIEQSRLEDALELLHQRGYGPAYRGDTRPWNFALGDEAGHEIDFHVIVLNENGDGIYGPAENGELYPAGALQGSGNIVGRHVDCISPEWLVRFHTGYELDENDRADVAALCARFEIPLPAEYR